MENINNKILFVRLPEEDLNYLKMRAAKELLSLSAFMRRVIHNQKQRTEMEENTNDNN